MAEREQVDHEEIRRLTSQIVEAYVAHHTVALSELSELIATATQNQLRRKEHRAKGQQKGLLPRGIDGAEQAPVRFPIASPSRTSLLPA
jgi:predicted transcriptional regulator